MANIFSFATSEAQKLVSKGAQCACVKDAVVFGWAIHYFEEDSIEGTLFNEDGSEYKKPIPTKKKTNYIKKLIKEEARFLFGKTPTFTIQVEDDKQQQQAEEINNYISNNTKYDLIAFRTNIVLPNGKKYKRKSYFTTSVEDQIILSTLSTQSCIFEKGFFEKIGKWDESLPCWNDWELGIRIMLSAPDILWIKHT